MGYHSMFNDKRFLSFLITFFSMSIMVLLLYNIHLGGGEEEDEYVVEMAIIEEEPTVEEEKEQQNTPQEKIKSHLAYNETAKPTYGSPEPLKTLDELLEESKTEENNEDPNATSTDDGYAESLKELAKKRKETKKLLGEKDAEKSETTHNFAKRRTSISYSLVQRNALALPPPTYTCIEGGKVVVNIVVDNLGNVLEAEFNKKSSNTSNGCLVDNAIEYAQKSKFNSGSKISQKGTITYIFQGK